MAHDEEYRISTTAPTSFVPEVWSDDASDLLLGEDSPSPTVSSVYEIRTMTDRLVLSFLGHTARLPVDDVLAVQADPDRRRSLLRDLVDEWGRTFRWRGVDGA